MSWCKYLAIITQSSMCLHLLVIRFHVSALHNIPCACICRNFLNSVINNGLHLPRGVLHGVISFFIVKGKINQSVFQYLLIYFSDLCLAFFLLLSSGIMSWFRYRQRQEDLISQGHLIFTQIRQLIELYYFSGI